MRRRLLALTVVVAAGSLGIAGCANGRFPPETLTTVTPTCQVANDVAPRLLQMMTDAYAGGVSWGVQLQPETSSFLPPGTPEPPRIESCYRSFEMQQWWRDYYCSIGQCGYAAVPGTSKHGLGRAVDFQDQLGELTYSSPGYVWLSMYAGNYGFFQSGSTAPGGSNPEPWHWESG